MLQSHQMFGKEKSKPDPSSDIIKKRIDTVLNTPIPTEHKEKKLSEHYLKKRYPNYNPRHK